MEMPELPRTLHLLDVDAEFSSSRKHVARWHPTVSMGFSIFCECHSVSVGSKAQLEPLCPPKYGSFLARRTFFFVRDSCVVSTELFQFVLLHAVLFILLLIQLGCY